MLVFTDYGLELESLSWLEKLVLKVFYRKLYKALTKPPPEGVRQLKKGKDGKFYWTEGESPFGSQPIIKKLSDFELAMNKIGFEPIMETRFIVRIESIPQHFIHRVNDFDKTAIVDITLGVERGKEPGTRFDIVSSLANLKEGQEIKTFEIDILSPTGEVDYSVYYKSVKVESVEYLSELSYESSEISQAQLHLEYEEKEIKSYV